MEKIQEKHQKTKSWNNMTNVNILLDDAVGNGGATDVKAVFHQKKTHWTSAARVDADVLWSCRRSPLSPKMVFHWSPCDHHTRTHTHTLQSQWEMEEFLEKRERKNKTLMRKCVPACCNWQEIKKRCMFEHDGLFRRYHWAQSAPPLSPPSLLTPPELMLKAGHQFQSVIRNFHCCSWHGWCVLIRQIPAARSRTQFQLWTWGMISIYSDVKTHIHNFWFTIFPHLRTLPVQLWKRAANHQCLHHSARRRGTFLSKGWMPELWNHSLEWKVFA